MAYLKDWTTCPICSKVFGTKNGLAKHLIKTHKLTIEQTIVQYELNGNRPLCKCGCGQPTVFRGEGFNEWIRGHISRVENNWGHNPIAIEKSATTRREQFKNGERQMWNTGLTGEEYLKHYDNEDGTNSLLENSKNPERNKKISDKLTGKKKSPEHAKIIADNSRNYWSKQENRDAQREKRLNYIHANGFVFTSKLEILFEEQVLKVLNIKYVSEFRIVNQVGFYDFYLPDYNLIIEVDGDYWHCNPLNNPIPKYDAQKYNINKDKIKNEIALSNNYNLIRFWEHDIKNNIEQVKTQLLEKINSITNH